MSSIYIYAVLFRCQASHRMLFFRHAIQCINSTHETASFHPKALLFRMVYFFVIVFSLILCTQFCEVAFGIGSFSHKLLHEISNLLSFFFKVVPFGRCRNFALGFKSAPVKFRRKFTIRIYLITICLNERGHLKFCVSSWARCTVVFDPAPTIRLR